MISQTVRYALNILGFLVRHQGGRVRGEDIAGETGVPANYLSKILNQLRKQGIVEAGKGWGGGFELRAEALERPIQEILVMFEGIERGSAEFFREFADRCHHGKEEDHLFATLHRQGMPLHQGPLAVMLHEHELGRNYVRELTALGAGSDGLDSTEQGRLREAATGYSELLRAHIQKEDNVLFPLALQTLSADTLAAVTDAFHRFEQDEMGEQVHERLHALAESLIAAYPPAPMPAATFAGCDCVGREC